MTDVQPEQGGSGASDAERRGGLTIERYGEIVAYMRYFPRRHAEEVVARLGVESKDWEEAKAGWTAALVDESENGEQTLSKRFGEGFIPVAARLAKEKPELASLGPLPGKPAEEVVPEKAAAPKSLSEAPAAFVPPSAAFVPPSAAFAPPSAAFAPPSAAFAPLSMAPLMASTPKVPPSLEVTSDIGSVVRPPALPFGPRGKDDPRPYPAAIAPAGPRAPSARAQQNVVGSETADISAFVRKYELPFNKEGAVAPAPPAAHENRPAAVSASPPKPPLELMQYASLCAELSVWPAEIAAILGKYRMSMEQRTALDRAWVERFERDPELYRQWTELRARYITWLETSSRRP